ncbi:MAG: hypothetical protein QOH25_985 [Acidobacteriota bacterium]|jgi:hypothetical protein|nr:hypothetical protein [Acidobacteriota bacterium]
MSQNEVKTIKKTYPSVDLAYSFAVASYEVAQKRIDAVDSRLQTLLALGATVSLPIPVLANAKALSFNSTWFIAAACAFAFAMIAGTVARLRGRIILLHPSQLYQSWLHFSEWEFKKNMVYFAGQHFEANRSLAEIRGRLTTLTASLFLVEGVCLAMWAVVHH